MISIFVLTMLIFLSLFLLLKIIKVKNDILICIFITLFTILFFLNINLSLEGIKKGLILCFNSIIPSIFSFSVICNLLIQFNGISLYSKILGPFICKPLRLTLNCSFILVASFLCGYPLGAKYAGDAYSSNLISDEEYIRILNIASNASPIFILGVLGASLLGNIQYGYLLLLSSFLSILFMSFILKPKNKTLSFKKEKIKATPKFGVALQVSIENAIKTTLSVCGYIVSFSLIITIIKNISFLQNAFYSLENILSIPKDSLYGTFLGSIEITNGCNLISNTNLSIHLKLSLFSFFCSFGGLSILFQTSSFFKENVSFLKHFLLKLVQGIVSFMITFIFSNLLIQNIYTSNITVTKHINLFSYIAFIIVIFLVIFLVIFFISKVKDLLKAS